MTTKPIRKEKYSASDISVIIPTWNNEDTIAPLLESLLAQPELPKEVLVIDDCSTDTTRSIVKRYPAPVRLLKLDINSGAATARNRGIKEAKGELLLFLDSDTVLLHNAIDALLLGFNTHPECVAMIGRTTITPLNKGIGPLYKAVVEGAWHDALVPWSNTTKIFIARIGAYVTETVRETGGFNEDIRGASVEDIELGLRYTKKYPIYYNPSLQAHHHFPTVSETIRNYWKRTISYMQLQSLSKDNLGEGGLSASSALQYIFGSLFFGGLFLTVLTSSCLLLTLSFMLFLGFLFSSRREVCALFKQSITTGIIGTFLHLLYGIVIVTAALKYKVARK